MKTESLPKTRKEAKEIGSTYYFTGKPCKHGHLSPKLTTSWQCVECRTLARNSTEGKSYHTQYVKDWNAENGERLPIYRKSWRDKNPSYGRQWRQENMGNVIASVNKRRAAKIQRVPFWLTPEDHQQIEELYTKAHQLTEETGMVHSVDHYYPLQGETVSGLHVPANLQILLRKDNSRKGNSFPGETTCQ